VQAVVVVKKAVADAVAKALPDGLTDNLATAAPNIRAGKLKALAVTTLARSSALPDTPPLSDTPEEFGLFMKNERSKYEVLVKASGAKVD
jgi:hypothetical protein